MFEKFKTHFIHETKRKVSVKFILLLLVILAYFIFLSNRYGASQGFSITSLTWAFFVLCTPIADAGFLLDFPVRLITGMRMLYSEILVWIIAIILSSYYVIANPGIFSSNLLLEVFHKILENPFPYWSIILISSAGTFFSIYFGDELIDTARHIHRIKHQKHKFKHRIIIATFLIAAVLILYDILLKNLGVNIPI